VLKSGFGQTLPGKKVFWAEALLTPKQQTPPTANVKTHVFLDMSLSLSSVELMMYRKVANDTIRRRATLLNELEQ
jgi:hypothetical protein